MNRAPASIAASELVSTRLAVMLALMDGDATGPEVADAIGTPATTARDALRDCERHEWLTLTRARRWRLTSAGVRQIANLYAGIDSSLRRRKNVSQR